MSEKSERDEQLLNMLKGLQEEKGTEGLLKALEHLSGMRKKEKKQEIEKEPNVNIISIAPMGDERSYVMFGLGSDSHVYIWLKREQKWYRHIQD